MTLALSPRCCDSLFSLDYLDFHDSQRGLIANRLLEGPGRLFDEAVCVPEAVPLYPRRVAPCGLIQEVSPVVLTELHVQRTGGPWNQIDLAYDVRGESPVS